VTNSEEQKQAQRDAEFHAAWRRGDVFAMSRLTVAQWVDLWADVKSYFSRVPLAHKYMALAFMVGLTLSFLR